MTRLPGLPSREGPESALETRFAVFAMLYACATMVHLTSFSFWMLRWQGWTLALATVLLLFRPQSLTLFVVFVVAALNRIWSQMPFVPNHFLFEGILNLTFLLALGGECWKRRQSGNEEPRMSLKAAFLATVMPVIRFEVALIYLFAAVQKLNRDYMNPETSCGTVIYASIRERLPLLPAGDWVDQAVIHGSLFIEFGLPLLLIWRRTAVWGVVIGLAFHFLLAFGPQGGISSFTGLVFALYVFFLPDATLKKWRDFWSGIFVIRPGHPARPGALKAIVVCLWILIFLHQGNLYRLYGANRDNFDFANQSGFVAFLIYGACFALSCLWAIWKTRKEWNAWGAPVMVRWVSTPAWLTVLLILANGFAPWVGTKTQTSWSMFSNLVSEGDGNHFFLKRVDFYNHQSEMVEFLESSPDLFKPKGRYADSMMHFNNPGRILPMFEVRRLVAALEGPVRLKYRVLATDEVIEASRDAAGKVTYPAVFEPPSYLERKLLWFRRLESIDGPMHCTH